MNCYRKYLAEENDRRINPPSNRKWILIISAFLLAALVRGAFAQMPPVIPVRVPKTVAKAYQTPKQASMAKSTAMRTRWLGTPPPKFIVMVWHSDYDGMTNVEVAVEASTGTVLGPTGPWKEKWHGQTNRVQFENTNRIEFFRAYNRFKK